MEKSKIKKEGFSGDKAGIVGLGGILVKRGGIFCLFSLLFRHFYGICVITFTDGVELRREIIGWSLWKQKNGVFFVLTRGTALSSSPQVVP
jgi:hypothetical protein